MLRVLRIELLKNAWKYLHLAWVMEMRFMMLRMGWKPAEHGYTKEETIHGASLMSPDFPKASSIYQITTTYPIRRESTLDLNLFCLLSFLLLISILWSRLQYDFSLLTIFQKQIKTHFHLVGTFCISWQKLPCLYQDLTQMAQSYLQGNVRYVSCLSASIMEWSPRSSNAPFTSFCSLTLSLCA